MIVVPPIFILVVAVTVGMLIFGLLRPPLAVVLPLIGVYVLLILTPLLLPTTPIGYLNPRYFLPPVVGLAMGYGVSLVASRYLGTEVPALLGLRRGGRGRKRVASGKAVRKAVVKPEELDRVVDEAINTMRLGVNPSELPSVWVEYYGDWAEAMEGMERRLNLLREAAGAVRADAAFLARAREYEERAVALGLGLREEAVRGGRRGRGSEVGELVVYVRPEELAVDLASAAQEVSGLVADFEGVMRELASNDWLPHYMSGAGVVVLYVGGVPRRFIIINRTG